MEFCELMWKEDLQQKFWQEFCDEICHHVYFRILGLKSDFVIIFELIMELVHITDFL
jgi:hypothetical protein